MEERREMLPPSLRAGRVHYKLGFSVCFMKVCLYKINMSHVNEQSVLPWEGLIDSIPVYSDSSTLVKTSS